MFEISLRNVWIVAKREYRERVRTRSFLLSTFVTPILMTTFLILPTLITTSTARGMFRDSGRPLRIVMATDNPALAELARGEMSREWGSQYNLSVDSSVSNQERQQLTNQLDLEAIDGYVWIDGDARTRKEVVLTTRRLGEFAFQQRMASALSYAFAAERLVKGGYPAGDVAATLARVDVKVVRSGTSFSAFNALRGAAVVLLLVFIMFFSLLSYGVMVMRSVMEEKASRITEVLLCSTTANELMSGKILGTGSVGLTQMGVWIAMAAFAASRSVYIRTAISVLEVAPSVLLYFVLFYVLGYLLYSAIFASVGAAFNSVDEAQQWNFVIILPLIAASAMILPTATTPNSMVSIVSSIFPFCAPVLMFERIAVHDPPAWQIALSFFLLLATIGMALIVCGRIYRVGILMYGKRPSARELARWLRHG
ncbi:MAG TPA: ABC transporter permease [Candidatus Acidoferrales bacterium]|nr:ABC transporter permease [Candidatus Acidoferrales bacterium]